MKELDNLIETELTKLDDSLNIEELNLDMDDLSNLEEVYIDKTPTLDLENLDQNTSDDFNQNIKMEINSSSEEPQEKVKTIFIDTNKEQNRVNTNNPRKDVMKKYGRKKDYSFFSDASNEI